MAAQDSAADVAAAILDAHARPEAWRALGENGRRHVLESYARPVVTRRYHQLITELASARQ